MPIASAILLTLAYPKFSLWWMAWVALIPLYILLSQTENAKTRVLYGFLFGLALFLGGLYWINEALGVFVWVLLAIVQGIWFAFLGALFRGNRPLSPVLFACLWVAFEWLRHLSLYGFPWFILATSQAPPSAHSLLQIVSITGLWGLSFAIAIVNALLGKALLKWKSQRKKGIFSLVTSIACVAALFLTGAFIDSGTVFDKQEEAHNIVRESGQEPSISIIQGNPEHVSLESLTDETLRGENRPALIVWPETAISPPSQPRNVPPIEEHQEETIVGQDVGRWKVPLISGVWRPRSHYWTNSAVFFDEKGQIIDHYDKQKPVPFGEFCPLRPLIGGIFEHFGGGPTNCVAGSTTHVFRDGSMAYGTLICYESAFPWLWRDNVLHGANVMVLTTSDEFFGTSAGPDQHFDMAIVRAVETRRWIVRAARTGTSAFISPYGHVDKTLPIGATGVLTDTIIPYTEQTFYMRFGEWFLWLCLTFLGFYFILLRFRPKFRL